MIKKQKSKGMAGFMIFVIILMVLVLLIAAFSVPIFGRIMNFIVGSGNKLTDMLIGEAGGITTVKVCDEEGAGSTKKVLLVWGRMGAHLDYKFSPDFTKGSKRKYSIAIQEEEIKGFRLGITDFSEDNEKSGLFGSFKKTVGTEAKSFSRKLFTGDWGEAFSGLMKDDEGDTLCIESWSVTYHGDTVLNISYGPRGYWLDADCPSTSIYKWKPEGCEKRIKHTGRAKGDEKNCPQKKKVEPCIGK